jgi:EpsG family
LSLSILPLLTQATPNAFTPGGPLPQTTMRCEIRTRRCLDPGRPVLDCIVDSGCQIVHLRGLHKLGDYPPMWPFLAFGSWFGVLATADDGGRINRFTWYMTFVMALIFIGLRHRVGTDWFNYIYMMDAVNSANSMTDLFSVCEPLYAALLKFSIWSGFGMYLANLVTAAAAMGGVFALARRMQEPWLAAMAAIPYLVVVIGMSANRQFFAIGLIMLLIANWQRTPFSMKIGWILLAMCFHKSAAIFMVFVVIDTKIHSYYKFVGIFILSSATIYIMSRGNSLDYYSNTYVSGEVTVESNGAMIHSAITAIPALILLLVPSVKRHTTEYPIIRFMAYGALACFILSYFLSTVGDRLSLYFFAVPMFVWAALPRAFPQSSRILVRFGIVLIMNGMMAGWLLYANEAESHIPYGNALLTPAWELDYPD